MGELTLAIETSNPSSGGTPGVALGWAEAGSVAFIDEEPIGAGERHDDLLMPAIRTLMERAGFVPGKLERVICSVGPGGYTGLRIATAAANMIALASGARLHAAPSAWVAAANFEASGPFAVALASKGESSFVTLFDQSGLESAPGRVMEAGDFADLGIRILLGDRFLPVSIREACDRLGVDVRSPVFSARACLGLVGRAPIVPTGGLSPLYGREAEAVTKWRELHPDSGRS